MTDTHKDVPEATSATLAGAAAVRAARAKPDDIPLVDPDELLTGAGPMPTGEQVFQLKDGRKVKILLRGLTYAKKSELDAIRTEEETEAEKTGVHGPDLHVPRLIAAAACTPDGQPKYASYEDQMVFAMHIAEKFSDGSIGRGGRKVLDLSGWSKEAEAEAGKS